MCQDDLKFQSANSPEISSGPAYLRDERFFAWVLSEYHNSHAATDKFYARYQFSLTATVAIGAGVYGLSRQALAMPDPPGIGQLVSILFGASAAMFLLYSLGHLISSVLPKELSQLPTTKEWADWLKSGSERAGEQEERAEFLSAVIDNALRAEHHNNQIIVERMNRYSDSVPPLAGAALLLGAQAFVTLFFSV